MRGNSKIQTLKKVLENLTSKKIRLEDETFCILRILESEDGTLCRIISKGEKEAIIQSKGLEEKIRGWYDKVDVHRVGNTFYGTVTKNGKEAMIMFNGLEEKTRRWYNPLRSWKHIKKILKRKKETTRWYDRVKSWHFRDNALYGVVKRNNKEALIIFDGRKEKRSRWHSKIPAEMVVNKTLYSIVKKTWIKRKREWYVALWIIRNVEHQKEAISIFDGRKEKTTRWYDGVRFISLNGNQFYGIIVEDGKEAIARIINKKARFSKRLEETTSNWYTEVDSDHFHITDNGTVYSIIHNKFWDQSGEYWLDAVIKFNGENEELSEWHPVIRDYAIIDGTFIGVAESDCGKCDRAIITFNGEEKTVDRRDLCCDWLIEGWEYVKRLDDKNNREQEEIIRYNKDPNKGFKIIPIDKKDPSKGFIRIEYTKNHSPPLDSICLL